jgi:hypothetical protein
MIQTKDIGKHIVYSDGRIWTKLFNRFCSTKITKTSKQQYELFKINRKPVYVHRLVAECFIPNPLNLSEINHRNGNKQDNRMENLEWVTRKENMRHAIKNNLFDNKGEKHKVAKLTDAEVYKIKYELKHIGSSELGRMYNVSHVCISKIKNNKKWKHI